MRVVSSGASGLIGTALSQSLRQGGHEVVHLVRREAQGPGESAWDPAKGSIDRDVIARADAVVNLAGASIGGQRLTESYREVVLQSRVDSTRTIAQAIAAENPRATLLQGSAMGFYGDRGEEELSERSPRGKGFLADICEAWEGAAAPAVDSGARVAYLRTGLVLAPHGGFAERLLPLVRRGVLRSLGSGEAWHSWISLRDEVAALTFLLDGDHAGPVNLVAPAPVRDRDLISSLAAALDTGTLLPVPAWAMRVAVGPAAEDLLSSQRAMPGVLARRGFAWADPDIDTAARWIVSQL